MDDTFMKLVSKHTDSDGSVSFYVSGDAVEVGEGKKTATYRLKPLAELYDVGLNRATLDGTDEDYEPLLHGIEMEILDIDDETEGELTDDLVLAALAQLATNPEAELPETTETENSVAPRIQMELRMILSLNDYSRHDVIQALERVAKTVEFHAKSQSPRGYLSFIQENLD